MTGDPALRPMPLRPVPLLKPIAIIGSMALLAICAAGAAWVRADPLDNPASLSAVPFFGNRSASLAAARAISAASDPASSDRTGGALVLDEAQQQAILSASLRSYRSEPLDVVAIGNLALLADLAGNAERSKDLLAQVRRLTKRDEVANLLLMRMRARQGDGEGALRLLDQTLRTSPGAQVILLPRLMEFLGTTGEVAIFEQMLRADPPWADAFWRDVLHHPAALPNAARLRIALHAQGVDLPPSRDQSLVSELVRAGHARSANELVHALTSQAGTPGEMLRDPSFEDADGFAPFAWQVFFESGFAADLDRNAGQLRITNRGTGSGLAARQMVMLEASRYLLRIDAADLGDAAFVRLACVDRNAPDQRLDFAILSAATTHAVTLSEGNCGDYWLELHVTLPEGRAARTMLVNVISLTAIDDRQGV